MRWYSHIPDHTTNMAARKVIPIIVHRSTCTDPCTTSSTSSFTPCTAASMTSGIAVTAAYAVDAPV
eukprot:1461523-Karenia_brevis.AAC.1